MKKFILHYLNPPAAMEAMQALGKASPEERKANMQKWMDWKASMGENLIDFGGPTMPMVTRLAANGDTAPASPELSIIGYSIVQAESLEALKAQLANHPHMNWREDVSIDIVELMPMG